MMIRVIDGAPAEYSIAQFRADYPGRSYPAGYPDVYLNRFDVYRVTQTPQPEGHVPDGFEQVNGQWQTKWRAKTEAETAAELEAWRASTSVPRLACRLALIEVSKWAPIQPAIDAIVDDAERETAQAFYEDANRWRRLDPFVVQIGIGALGYDDLGLDALFRRAQEIDASLG